MCRQACTVTVQARASNTIDTLNKSQQRNIVIVLRKKLNKRQYRNTLVVVL